MITYRPLQRADMEAYGELCRYAFQMTAEQTPLYTEWVANFIDHSWGAFDNKVLCAGMWYYPYEMRVGDAMLPMGGVAAVATRPEYRDRGIVREMMTRAHRQMRKEGRSLAVLMPFQHRFYYLMGYADTFFHLRFSFDPNQIERRDAGRYTLRSVDGEREWQTLEKLHQEYGAHCFGTVRRDRLYWKYRYLAPREGAKHVYLVERGTEPRGFIITRIERETVSGKQHLEIIQAVWLDQEAFAAITQFLRQHRDQVPKITWHLPIDVPIHDQMTDSEIDVQLKPKMMLKLVDFKRALESRSYPSGLTGEIVIDLRADPTSPWNEGQWRLRWRDGHVRVQKAKSSQGAAHLRTDIQTMAIAYSGRQNASQLAASGRLEGNGAAVETFDRAFPRNVPYIDEWF